MPHSPAAPQAQACKGTAALWNGESAGDSNTSVGKANGRSAAGSSCLRPLSRGWGLCVSVTAVEMSLLVPSAETGQRALTVLHQGAAGRGLGRAPPRARQSPVASRVDRTAVAAALCLCEGCPCHPEAPGTPLHPKVWPPDSAMGLAACEFGGAQTLSLSQLMGSLYLGPQPGPPVIPSASSARVASLGLLSICNSVAGDGPLRPRLSTPPAPPGPLPSHGHLASWTHHASPQSSNLSFPQLTTRQSVTYAQNGVPTGGRGQGPDPCPCPRRPSHQLCRALQQCPVAATAVDGVVTGTLPTPHTSCPPGGA